MSNIFDPFRAGRFLGFDNLFQDLDRFSSSLTEKISWPPYDLIKFTENFYQVQFALAGFKPEDVNVYIEDGYLVVRSVIQDKKEGPQYLHKGIAMRDFLVKFLLADGVDVSDVVMDNGILRIDVKKVQADSERVEFTVRSPMLDALNVYAANTGQNTEETYPRSDMVAESEAV